MKNLTKCLTVFSLSAAILLSGCDGGNSKTQEEHSISDTSESLNTSESSDGSENTYPDISQSSYSTLPVSDIRANYEEYTKALKEKDYTNLSFEEAEFTFPDIDEIYYLSLSMREPRADEMYKLLSEGAETLFPGMYTDEEKAYEIRFLDGISIGANYPYNYPTLREYLDGRSGYNPMPAIQNNEVFLDAISGVLRAYDNGQISKMDGWEGHLNIYGMGEHEVVLSTTDLKKEDAFALSDGTVSIKDAAEYIRNFLETAKLTVDPPDAICRPVNVRAYDLGNGKYGYSFTVTEEYKDVLFDYTVPIDGSDMTYSVKNDYDNRQYFPLSGFINMLQKDKICAFVNIASTYDMSEGETYKSVISLEQAADIVSDFFSDHMDLNAKNVEVVYLRYNEAGNYDPFTFAVPCWKFKFRQNDEMYNVMVNMITGEVHLYILALD